MNTVHTNLVGNACRHVNTEWWARDAAGTHGTAGGSIVLGTDLVEYITSYASYTIGAGVSDFLDVYKELALPARLDGTTYSMGVIARHAFSGPVTLYPIVYFTYTDANGVSHNGSRQPQASALVSPASATWLQLSGVVDFATIEGAVLSSVVITGFGVRAQTFPGNLPAGSLRATGLYIVENADPSTPYTGAYFDGDYPNTSTVDYQWLGAQYLSQSAAIQQSVAPLVPPSSPIATPDPPAPTVGVIPRSYSPINLTDFSVVEDSTPVDPSETTGGVGQFTLSIGERDDTKYLQGVPVNLSVISQGETTGTVRGLSGSDGAALVTADSRLALLNANRTAQPVNGTLATVFTYYLGLVGITSGIVVDTSVASTAVVFPGWSGNVWDQVRKMALSLGCEVSLVSNNVVLRPTRLRDAETYRDVSRGWASDSSQMAKSIEVYWYNSTPITSTLVYPVGGWNVDVPIFTVGLGEVQTFDIPLSASLSSITQPVAQDFVDRYYTGGSVYAVTDSDGLPYLAAQWNADGGSVTVAINEDTRGITVTVTAPTTSTIPGPYSIAVAAGPSDRYSSLRLLGTGVAFSKELLTMDTSVDPDFVSVEVGATVDNEFITTQAQAVHTGLWTLKRYGAPRYTISVTSGGVNRLGDNGSYRYPTVAEFNVLYSGDLVNDFNTEWSGQTVDDFNEYMVSLVSDTFANQAFGNIAGARVRYLDVIFRIRSATNSSTSISYTAEDDTTVDDFNEVWVGATVNDFNAEWLGQPLSDFPMASLKRSA